MDAPIIAYSLGELHQLYKGDGSYPSYDTFRAWLDKVQPKIEITGRILTPAQVKIIFEHLGPPTITDGIVKKVPSLIPFVGKEKGKSQ